MQFKKISIIALFFLISGIFFSFVDKDTKIQVTRLLTGADQTEKYLPLLKNKRVAILANPTTIIGQSHLVDSLQHLGINIVKVFGPDEIDAKTGIPVISLYGGKSKPSKEDLADVDLMIYDLQDVGCRFYTNINALARLMEACAENNKELLILDRPNPNGYFIDGPVLDMQFKSGIGMFPIPITHGLTIGEFAQMLNGEGWLSNHIQCKITIIKVANYRHDMKYTLPVKPSPNLNSQKSIWLYPSLCLFEGTIISQGRGTNFPFTVLGNPLLKGAYSFNFTPISIKGMAETPLHMNETCYGLDLRDYPIDGLMRIKKINISWMIEMYHAYPDKAKFFDYKQSKEMGNIDKLAGTSQFKEQIMAGASEATIRASWEPGLKAFKKMRKKYLLYP